MLYNIYGSDIMKKVLIGISGGVDSSVSALLLKNEGYNVIGATMNLLDNQNNCDSIEVCKKLDIDYVELDYKNEFNNCIIKYFMIKVLFSCAVQIFYR